MNIPSAATIAVIDSRRQGMMLEWRIADGTWAPSDTAPSLLHGIALIRASQPNICVYGLGGQLHFQAGADRFALEPDHPRLACSRGIATFGFRRRFSIVARDGKPQFSLGYWSAQRHDFFRWLAAKAADSGWRSTCGTRWSEGVAAKELRSTQ